MAGLAVAGAELDANWASSVCLALQQQLGSCDALTLARALYAMSEAGLEPPQGFLQAALQRVAAQEEQLTVLAVAQLLHASSRLQVGRCLGGCDAIALGPCLS